MQNSVSMIMTKTKNFAKEKKYLKSIVSKLEVTSNQFINLSKSITKIDEKISVLISERHNILGSELYKRTNKTFHANKHKTFDIKDTDSIVLNLEDEMYPPSEGVGSLEEIVSDLASEETGPPVSSIKFLKRSHSYNHSNKSISNESASSASHRKYRTILLRCSTFFIRPLIPLLSKRKDDALPYPLRL